MRTFTLFSTFLCVQLWSLTGCAQSDTLYLWSNEVPGQTVAKKAPATVPSKGDNVLRLTNVTNPCLHVYLPKGEKKSDVGIIVSPGGGYSILAWDKSGTEVAEWLNSLGYTAFVLQYRVPKQHKGALQDMQRAIRLVKGKAAEYGLDPNKVGLFGCSAGGNLSVKAATHYQQNTYAAIDAHDTLSTKPAFVGLLYPAYLDDAKTNTLREEIAIDSLSPPMFMFASADDIPHSSGSLVLATALRAHKVPVEMHLFPTGKHGYGMRKGIEAAETWPPLAAKWLERTLERLFDETK